MAEKEVDPFQEMPFLKDGEYIGGIMPVAGAIFCWTNWRVFRYVTKIEGGGRWEETKFWSMIGGPAS